jgi:hypothetical protein
MLRPLLLVAAVCACASPAPAIRPNASPVPFGTSGAERATVRTGDATNGHGARLAPPFGGTAGVRRVTTTNEAVFDAAPGVVAAADPRD